MAEKVERDRLSAYVEPITTKLIEDVKKQHFEEFGVKLTIGQVVDLVFKFYANNKK